MRRYNSLLLLCVLLGGTQSFVYAVKNITEGVAEDAAARVLEDKLENKIDQKQDLKTISFNFTDEDLVDVINTVAGAMDVNVVLPSGANAIKSKLTINVPQKLTAHEAWDILYTVLDVAGYGVALRSGMYAIVKKDDSITREPYRIFIATPYEKIPDTDERIIYLAYFANIQVPSGEGADGQNVVQQLLTTYLSPESAKNFKFIASSNGVMIIDKASNIRAIMKILKELDKAGTKEHLEMIQLQHASSEEVTKLFNKENGILEKPSAQRYRLGTRRKSDVRYFEKGTKIISEPRTNSIIILGSKDSVERVKDFVYRYIDIPMQEGRSILHTRKLDYLDANKLRDVLRKVVGTEGEAGIQGRPGGGGAGPEKFFDNPLIETDRPAEAEGEAEEGKYKYYGTNSLVVAAKNDDWKKIGELVDKLDKPLRQVLIETLIVDLRLEDNKQLGAQTRNPALAPLMKLSREGRGMDAQSSQLTFPITQACKECDVDSRTLKADLMQDKVYKDSENPDVTNPLFSAQAGSTLFTISDKNGKTWSVLRLLNLYSNRKVLSHPYIVAINNQDALVKVGLQKILTGNAETGNVGTRINYVPVNADITLNVRPRIGGMHDGEPIVNLQVGLTVNEFAEDVAGNQSSEQPRFIREISTNANIRHGEILVLGGLIRDESNKARTRLPILGRIPILGWLFKNRSESRVKNNLTVFIRVTVIEPEFRSELGDFSKDYVKIAKQYSTEGELFEGLRDPITRWFFRSGGTTKQVIEEFIEQHEKVIPLEELNLVDANGKIDAGNDLLSSFILADGTGDKKDTFAADAGIKIAQHKDVAYTEVDQAFGSDQEKINNAVQENIIIIDNNGVNSVDIHSSQYEGAFAQTVSDDGVQIAHDASGNALMTQEKDVLAELLQNVELVSADSIKKNRSVEVSGGQDKLKSLLAAEDDSPFAAAA